MDIRSLGPYNPYEPLSLSQLRDIYFCHIILAMLQEFHENIAELALAAKRDGERASEKHRAERVAQERKIII